ncbi:MAG TPA: hemerythrin domain-containing protein [Chloroflexia bacterium]|nr:hemerythrin domain-containing protein [Chloroflexia bacterium]
MLDNNMTFSRPTRFKMDGFLAIHKAMRKEIVALDEAIKQIDFHKPDSATVARMERWFHFYWDMVVAHHETEDKVFFPILVQRDLDFGEKMRLLEMDHNELHSMVDSLVRLFRELLDFKNSFDERLVLGHRLTNLTGRFREKLLTHLQREEEMMLPVVAARLSEKEQQDFEKQLQKTTPRQHLALALPWILSALDEAEFRKLYSTLPLPLRLFYRLSWKSKYDRLTAIFQS